MLQIQNFYVLLYGMNRELWFWSAELSFNCACTNWTVPRLDRPFSDNVSILLLSLPLFQSHNFFVLSTVVINDFSFFQCFYFAVVITFIPESQFHCTTYHCYDFSFFQRRYDARLKSSHEKKKIEAELNDRRGLRHQVWYIMKILPLFSGCFSEATVV